LQWYEDDGTSLAYARGEIHERTIEFLPGRQRWRLCFSEAAGAFASEVKTWRVILRGADRPLRVTVNGRPARGRFARPLGIFAFQIPNAASSIDVRLE